MDELDRLFVNDSLRDLYERTAKHFTDKEIEVAHEAAIELIACAGFDHSDSDRLGDECENQLQTLLMLALLRRPELDHDWEGDDDEYADELDQG
jgi:hypothetical protein